MMRISAFGDEIAVDFEEQLQVMQRLGIPLIDIRAAWGVNCSQFTEDHVPRIKDLCAQYAIEVSCMGSPIGKSPIEDPIEIECERLRRVGAVADKLSTRNIRIFSFYPVAGVDETAMQCAIDRLGKLTDIAKTLDLQLLLENEKGIVGDLPENCLKLMTAIDSPNFRFIWDPANFVQCGAAQHVDAWWDALHPYIGYIHIKDARLPEDASTAEGQRRSAVTVAGQGDGQMKELLARLHKSGYDGVLSLEPHLVEARHSSGFSGADGMETAVNALRGLMAQVGIEEGR